MLFDSFRLWIDWFPDDRAHPYRVGRNEISSLSRNPKRHALIRSSIGTGRTSSAALHDEATDRLAIYYGAADTCTCVAYAHLGELIDFVKRHSVVF